MRLVKLATCNLNQWAMDFEGNLHRIKASIQQAKDEGAILRVGPELEVTGYGCEDHFLEPDTCMHAWECLRDILMSDLTHGILCDIGMPVVQDGVRYNCRVFCYDSRILLIRPKVYLANDGNYRELRWFSAWKRPHQLEELALPPTIATAIAQRMVPFGDGYLAFADTTIGVESCEELFTPLSPHISLALRGVEIIVNGSGSHHQLRKLNQRLELIRGATSKAGGVYIYSNQQGCDGGRLYYDGCACVAVNGDIVAQGSQFSLRDVEVLMARVDLDAVTSYRGAVSSLREQASHQTAIPCVKVEAHLCEISDRLGSFPSLPIEEFEILVSDLRIEEVLRKFCVRSRMLNLGRGVCEFLSVHARQGQEGQNVYSQQVKYHVPEEEIALGPACWLWDYLRRSGASGFLLPLSGGADSSSVAAIVGCMSQLVVKAIAEGDEQVQSDAIRVGNYLDEELPKDPREFANRILHTVYMGSENSSEDTRSRAERLAKQIGASHVNLKIDAVVSALVFLFKSVTGKTPQYKVDGGSTAENLALQNIQARIRMVIAFMLASLMPWVRSKPGFLLVLGSANVDEGLRGYLTKYDCSSADINPIGGISKTDLRNFLRWGAKNLGFSTLAEIEAAPPTAELEPIRANYTQLDEVDMGMTYEELSMYGRLRKIFQCGPVSMFQHLCHRWDGRLRPSEVAVKVKAFFRYYSLNRHKMTTLTPSYHAENYSPEDNRFDLRQFLYNTRWPWQFRRIDELVIIKEDGGASPSDGLSNGPTEVEAASIHASGMGVPAANSGSAFVGTGA